MKKRFFPLLVLLSAGGLQAEPEPAKEPAPVYVDEAPLPKGWPQPGPYDEVVEKKYPAYRAAFTGGKGETLAFWTLFAHIKRKDIPMTAPVEMGLDAEDKQASMAFLYQSDEVGNPGQDGNKVEVRDVPAAPALSYAWQGTDSKENIAKAKAALEASLGQRKVEPKGFRLLGYNGPGTPRAKRTWELQALLK
ncbi:heme-binding protein [Luteolibacter arcticus]|uniref:Heme-binding protein n=1 Tax=Luteolibacter arcticus TaxID=1581411 RepID=A0ABT3GPL5_9BACT|nr:heme-binding protein [Luteolibacter arcticus]MCW1925413.1 heme-binding protein [Luteolibacter arcticus]